MHGSPRVLVIIPAYNEEDNILDVVKNVQASGYDYVVIDDGSTDSTADICNRNHINIVTLPQNLGIGGAVQTGHIYAYDRGYDVDIQVDGDGQHDPSYISKLVDAISNGSDLVIGSRFIEKTDGFQSTFMRRVGITWLAFCIKALTGKTITDPTSGFRACGRRAIKLFCESYPVDYPEPDSIASALKVGLEVSEVSVVMRERQGGISSIGLLSSVYYMVKVTLAIWITCMSQNRKLR